MDFSYSLFRIENNVSETDSVSVLGWNGGTYSVGFVRKILYKNVIFLIRAIGYVQPITTSSVWLSLWNIN
jgi:hypothetical protein